MNSARFSRFALYGLACLILVTAILIWNDRTARARQVQALQVAATQQQQSQRAIALLYRALQAENDMTYAARSHTMTAYGKQKIKSVAWMVQAPDHLYIKYLDGQYKDMECGYSERWFYRQCHNTKRMLPYAEVEQKPGQMAARRFALMLENYHAEWVQSDRLENRPVEIVQLSPLHPLEGARGPAQRLWIDKETGLPLRTENFDCQMRPVMDISLSNLDFAPDITLATFKPPAQIADMTKSEPWVTRDMGRNRAAVEEMTGLRAPQPEYLPRGFVLDYVGVHRLNVLVADNPSPTTPRDYAALSRFTDGLNTLTVFAVRAQNETAANDNYNFGPGTLAMRSVSDGYLVAVADLPPPILRRVLDSTPEQIKGNG